MAEVRPDSKSRYKVAGKAFDGQIKAKDVAAMVNDLREVFYTEKTYTLEWRKNQLKALKRCLIENEKEFCDAMYEDLHKSHFEGFATELQVIIGEIDNALHHLADWMKPEVKGNTLMTIPSWSAVHSNPLGVVLVLGSWNYPMYLSINPIVGAIAAGNCVVLKPGSYAISSSHVMCTLLNKYLDPDCIKVIEGNRDVTNALLEQRFDKIFFTGSGYVGRIVAEAAAKHLTPCVLELGGKSPTIIDKSADLDHTINRLVWGTFMNGGQTCVRPDFVLIHNDVADEFFRKFKATVEKFYSSNPKSSKWFGRCINAAAVNRLADLVDKHKKNIVIGGEVDKTEKYIAPTVFDFGSDLNAFAKQEVMLDEIFGPLVPCARFSNLEQVVEFVKHLSTGKPLALYAFGSDPLFIKTIKERTTSGGCTINDILLHLANHELPFGGVGASGMGNYHGKYSFDCFSHQRSVLEKSQKMEANPIVGGLLGARFPPYEGNSMWKQHIIRGFSSPVVTFLGHYLNHIPAPMTLLKIFVTLVILRLLGFKVTRG